MMSTGDAGLGIRGEDRLLAEDRLSLALVVVLPDGVLLFMSGVVLLLPNSSSENWSGIVSVSETLDKLVCEMKRKC